MRHIYLKLTLFIFVCFREIFPYLVVFVGLENVLVITKSVVSTPVDLDVRLRIAQGQSTGSRSGKNREFHSLSSQFCNSEHREKHSALNEDFNSSQ